MKTSHGTRALVTVLAVICAACLILAAGFFLPLFHFFCLYDSDAPGSVLVPTTLSRPVTEFVITYTHSVNKGRVRDYYAIASDRSLVLLKTRFVSYGAGMSEPEDSGTFIAEDGFYELANLNRTMPRLALAVGVVANHALEIGSATFVLADYFEPQTPLIIGYRAISVFDYMKRKQN